MPNSLKPMSREMYQQWVQGLTAPQPSTAEMALALLQARAREAYERQDTEVLPTVYDVAQHCGISSSHGRNVMRQLMDDGLAVRTRQGRVWRWLPAQELAQ